MEARTLQARRPPIDPAFAARRQAVLDLQNPGKPRLPALERMDPRAVAVGAQMLVAFGVSAERINAILPNPEALRAEPQTPDRK